MAQTMFFNAEIHRDDWISCRHAFRAFMAQYLKDAEQETDNERASSLYDTHAGLCGIHNAIEAGYLKP